MVEHVTPSFFRSLSGRLLVAALLTAPCARPATSRAAQTDEDPGETLVVSDNPLASRESSPTDEDLSREILSRRPSAVYVNSCRRVTGRFLSSIAQAPEVRSVAVTHCPEFVGTWLIFLAPCEQLEELDFTGTPIDANDVAILAEHRGLRRLELGGTGITDDVAKSLGTFPSLSSLNLAGCQVGDAVVAGLSERQLAQMTSLDLSGTAVTDKSLRRLSQCRNLVTLRLDHCRVTDEGVSGLSQVATLRHVSLTGTRITGECFAELGTLPELESLDAGLVPLQWSDLYHLAECDSLKRLQIDGTGATVNLGVLLARYPDLVELNVSGCVMAPGSLKGIARSPGLHELGLAAAGISDADVQRLSKAFPELSVLDLAANDAISDRSIDALCRMKQLRSLDLGSTAVTQQGVVRIQNELKDCELSLAAVRFRDNPFSNPGTPGVGGAALNIVTTPGSIPVRPIPVRAGELEFVKAINAVGGRVELDESGSVTEVVFGGRSGIRDGLKQLKELPKLRSLRLGSSQVTDSDLQLLAELRMTLWSLDLHNTSVTDTGLEHLEGLTMLRSLRLQETEISDAGLVSLAQLKNLRELDISRTGITDSGLRRLSVLRNLQSLRLNVTPVTDAGLRYLKGLANLEELSLGGTRITDTGLEHLRRLTHLRSLSLFGTQVTDVGIERLKVLTSLQALNLQKTRITDGGLQYLTWLTNLQTLNVANTDVTVAGTSELKAALPGCWITP